MDLTKLGLFGLAALSAAVASAMPPLSKETSIEESKEALPVGGLEENSRPYDLPPGYKQNKITDRNTLTGQGLPATFGNWDMVTFAAPEGAAAGAYPNAGDFIFIPAEVSDGAGLFRYDVAAGTFVTLLEGLGGGNAARQSDPNVWNPLADEYTRLDPATYTPFDTIVTGEETTGGRLFEIRNPLADNAADANVRWLTQVPAVAHEGIRFDATGAMYFVDENNSGSVYKFVPMTPGDLGIGQSFVLAVDAYDGNPSENWDSASNDAAPRVGSATWVPITDADGNPLTVVDPFIFADAGIGVVPTGTAGRAAADELNGTPYGRPEDVVIQALNGTEVLYFTATSEDAAYSVVLTSALTAEVKIFVDRSTIDVATGAGVGTAFNNPDNMAIDADGNVYVIEDQEPDVSDIWQVIDEDGDAVGDRIGRWLTQGVTGSEPTGLIFDPNAPKRAILAVQHPDSGNDALWQVTLGERKGQVEVK
ncbi:MAG: alkaline phosphatase PhoX [Gammaproteobacteria bacterium]